MMRLHSMLFILKCITPTDNSQIFLRQLPGKGAKVIDVETSCPIDYICKSNGIDIDVNVPFGKTQLIKITYQK